MSDIEHNDECEAQSACACLERAELTRLRAELDATLENYKSESRDHADEVLELRGELNRAQAEVERRRVMDEDRYNEAIARAEKAEAEVVALKKAVLAKCPGPGSILVFDGPVPEIRFDGACHNHLILSRVEFSNQVAALKAEVRDAHASCCPMPKGECRMLEEALAAKPEQEGK